MFELVTFLIVAAAAVRITRLLVVDKICEPFRLWVARKAGQDSMTAFLFWCPWCIGFWVCLPAALALWAWGGADDYLMLPWWSAIPGLWFALSWLVGLAVAKEK